MQKKIHNFWHNHKSLAVILLLAFLVRGLFLFLVFKESGSSGFASPVNEDSLEYISIARNLTQYGIFSRDSSPPFTPERLRTPGYPLFLSLFYRIYPHLTFLVVIQNLFFLLAIILLYKIILAIIVNKKIALMASGFFAVEPTMLYWNSQLTTESLFTLVILASFFCLTLFLKQSRLKFVFYSGFFLGFALLVRPIAQYLYIIFLGGILIVGFLEKLSWKNIFSGFAIFLFGYALIVAPWAFRNKNLFGTTAVSIINVGFGKYLTAMNDELGIQNDYKMFNGKMISSAEQLTIVPQEALRTILAHPLLFAKIHFFGLLPFFLGDGYVAALESVLPPLRDAHVVTNWSGSPSQLLTFAFGHHGIEAIVFWFGKFIWLVISILWIIGFVSLIRIGGSKRYFTVFLGLIIYYFALAGGVGSYSRFRFPVNPFIFYFAAVGINVLISKFFTKKTDSSHPYGTDHN